ncbi:MAG: hypothetical protein JWM67_2998 [Mycobacterium sp.]|jgi:UDP-glucose 4-epimerase|nr:hypothetical protein [Mycobacterium sp.]
MRIAVTGATGNVGTRLLEQLHTEPDIEQVVAIARRLPTGDGLPPFLTENVVWRSIDVASPDSPAQLRAAFAGVDAVVHLAWLIQPSHAPELMRAVNVDGTRHVVRALLDAGVPTLVALSSVGAYSPAPKSTPVAESWPTEGVPGSMYSAHKAAQERVLDDTEAERPGLRVVRVRPGVILQRQAASSQGRYFLGPFLPVGLLRPGHLPVLPLPRGLRLQIVHTADVARAVVLALRSDVRGGLNLAADPPLDAGTLGAFFSARVVPLPPAAVRAAVELTWRLRLHPTDRGWVELALRSPVLATAKARSLGWEPRHDALSTLREWLEGAHAASGGPTPVLRRVTGPVDQLRSGLRALRAGSGGRI